MDEDEQRYPEDVPGNGLNRFDYLRVSLLPVAGLAQGIVLMLDQFMHMLSLQSLVHDEKKEAKKLSDSFK